MEQEQFTKAELLALLPRSEAFTSGQSGLLANDFQSEMGRVIDGGVGNVRMIDSKISPDKLTGEMIPDSSCLVVDSGGTSAKFAVYRVGKDGNSLEISSASDGSQSSFETPYGNNTKWQAADYFAFHRTAMIDKWGEVEYARVMNMVDAEDFIFSFEADAEKNEAGVDVRVRTDDFSKGISFYGMSEGGPVGAQFFNNLESGCNVKSNKTRVTQNDTVAIIGPDNQAATICGTGFNIVVKLGDKLYNTECGRFESDYLPKSGIYKKYNASLAQESQNIGMAEKMITGQGVGGQFALFARLAAQSGLLPEGMKGNIFQDSQASNRMMSALLMDDDFKSAKEFLTEMSGINNIEDDQLNLLRTASESLINNSIKVHAAMLVGIANQSIKRGGFKGDRFVIPVEGSFFWKTPGYADRLRVEVDLIYNGEDVRDVFEFVGEGKRLGIEGAARQALLIHANRVREVQTIQRSDV